MWENKYFYVICRDGQIIEVENDKQTFEAIFNSMVEKGVVILKELGLILNGVDISKVLKEDQYDNWVSSVKPREYIKNGIWLDGKERKMVRCEKWQEEKMESQKRLDNPNYQKKSKEDIERISKLLEKYKPNLIKEIENNEING